MATYTPTDCAQNSLTEYSATIGAEIYPTDPYTPNLTRGGGTLYLGANNQGDGAPPQSIANLQWFYQDSGIISGVDYEAVPGGFSGPALTAYLDAPLFLIFGVVDATGKDSGYQRTFSYDGAMAYQNINNDYPDFTFEFGWEGMAPIGGSRLAPEIGIMYILAADNKYCLQMLDRNAGTSETINMIEYDADHNVYTDAAAFLNEGGFHYFGYAGYFDDGVDYLEKCLISKVTPAPYSDPIAAENLDLNFLDSPVDVAFWGGSISGQSNDRFYFVVVDFDLEKSYLFSIAFDGSDYDVYVIHDLMSYAISIDSGGDVVAMLSDGSLFQVILSPLAPADAPKTVNLKIGDGIKLPCYSPCIPLIIKEDYSL